MLYEGLKLVLLYFSHPYITEAEKDMIEVSLGKRWFLPDTIKPSSPSEESYSSQDAPNLSENCQYVTNMNCDTNNSCQEEISEISRQKKKKISVPWRHIFTSPPFWAIFLCTIPQTYGGYTLLIELPKYLSNILHYDLNEVCTSQLVKSNLMSLKTLTNVFV